MGAIDKLRKGYHNILRPEILSLIPKTATAILDLGCGSGELGKALRARQKCIVDGIELNKAAADIARQNLNVVYQDNLNRFDPKFLKTKYDVIVFGDILEHLVFPWSVLKNFSSVLRDNGVVVASVPNVAHPWIAHQLLKGLFRYQTAGILDITHLRFFTKTTICQLFYRAGLKIKSIDPYPSQENPRQWLVTAVKPIVEHTSPVVTVLMLTHNAWDYTAQAINSIKTHTDRPYKLLVIDNGSTDGTVQNLRQDTSIFHVENTCNLGFATGFNVGLEMIDTPFFVICNSDIVVTKNWLSVMLDQIKSDDNLMVLGPRSNYVSGPQLVRDVPYNNQKTLEAFAEQWFNNPGQPISYFHRIVFFCTLFKRQVLETIGMLDERFDYGNFDDDDYCLRVKQKGYSLAYSNNVFIHHYGSITFKENKLDYAQIMEVNKKRFMDKWNIKQEPGL